VGYHRLDDKVRELPNRSFVCGLSVGIEFAMNGYLSRGFLFYPLFGLVVVCADKDEFVLSPALYELVGFNDSLLSSPPLVLIRKLRHVGVWSYGDNLV